MTAEELELEVQRVLRTATDATACLEILRRVFDYIDQLPDSARTEYAHAARVAEAPFDAAFKIDRQQAERWLIDRRVPNGSRARFVVGRLQQRVTAAQTSGRVIDH